MKVLQNITYKTAADGQLVFSDFNTVEEETPANSFIQEIKELLIERIKIRKGKEIDSLALSKKLGR